jgi:YD repeat-containing protein
MSQTVQIPPPPPIGPPKGDTLRYVIFAAVFILGLVVLLELRLLNSPAGQEAAQRIRENPRVKAEFGDDVHIPFAVGWDFGSQGKIYPLVRGTRAHGYAVVDLAKHGVDWVIANLEVKNVAEGHLISLAPAPTPATREQLQGAGKLYFVVLGDGADGDVSDLVSFFQNEFGIPAKALSPMSLPAEAYDSRRKQWIAEMLVEAIRAKYPEIVADPEARIVGVLEDDLYIYWFNWDYTYGYRQYDKISVLPTVRMDPGFYHHAPDATIRAERLRKVAMKAVGLLYFGFKESSQPQSVDAFEYTIDAIDRMGSVYLESDVKTRALVGPIGYDGTPCLTFFSSTLAGAALTDPVVPCSQQGDSEESTRFQIDLLHGRFQLVRNELYRGGVMPLLLQRENFSYRFDDKVRAFGKNSWQSLDDTVWSADPNSIQTINIYGTVFHRVTAGTGFSPQARYFGEDNSSEFSGALLTWENGWRIDTRRGQMWRYRGCSPTTRIPCYYMGQKNFRGDSIEVRRDPNTGHIQQVLQQTNAGLPAIAALDHRWEPIYDGEKIIEIHDSDGRTAHYRYDTQEYLTDVTADGHTIHYDYDDSHRIAAVIEDGHAVRIHYDPEGRADRVDLANGSFYTVKYAQDAMVVNGPGASYTVTIMPTYFRVVQRAE